MRNLILFGLILASPAFAVSPDTCAALCNKINRINPAICGIYHVREYGAILFLDAKALAKDNDDQTILLESLQDCFLATGGAQIEVQTGKSGNSSPYAICRASRTTGTGMVCDAHTKKDYDEVVATALKKGRYLIGAKLTGK